MLGCWGLGWRGGGEVGAGAEERGGQKIKIFFFPWTPREVEAAGPQSSLGGPPPKLGWKWKCMRKPMKSPPA